MDTGTNQSPPGDFLRRILLERVHKNSSYSLRALARDLNVSHAYLSYIMAGKKPLSLRKAHAFSDLLKLPDGQRRQLVDSVAHVSPPHLRPSAPSTKSFFKLEVEGFKVLSSWYHLAILDLMDVDKFQPDPKWIARRLGIRTSQVKTAIGRLQRLGLLKITGKKWRKTNWNVAIEPQTTLPAIRKFHQQTITKALAQLDSESPEDYALRSITGATVAVDIERLEEAYERINTFRRSLIKFLSKGKPGRVFHIGIQLFPLDHSEKGTL